MTSSHPNEVVVITGASSGIGRALAMKLAVRGARMILGGREQSALDALVQELRELGASAQAVAGDVRQEGVLQGMVQAAVDQHGRLDVMINNAGVTYPGQVLEGQTRQWSEMLETNALAVFVGCREAARCLGAGGVIVNISSLAGATPTPEDAVYSASKHAVHAFSAALRVELAERGIHVLVVEPGQTMTNIARGLSVERLRILGSALGLDPADIPDFQGRHAPPEFADSVLRQHASQFLSSEEVAEAVVAALSTSPIPARLRILPGNPPSIDAWPEGT
ncbi:MAG: SDR family oxidoreductase [Planctomycetota bacterium]|nr:SDR family oxidoreductase [Planctomycetota bacterium]